ncbi:hypothetical protein ADIMK_1970 [Marinobacterium lacunae]|uniref:Uncharacterized protein n=1 Tax=Marinobacterium lacunae TaxID=1232683 RepID=A0A081FZ88_9GAMM|nr:hypothetical protein ADIMK_1970 [Marinobacterium lacunae]
MFRDSLVHEADRQLFIENQARNKSQETIFGLIGFIIWGKWLVGFRPAHIELLVWMGVAVGIVPANKVASKVA